ncbi:MAG TPA: 23S rRNA (uracil(1939)-C(5))-methyltransferase RlmD [Spirochaetota bacterium]
MGRRHLHRKKYKHQMMELSLPYAGSAEPACPYFGKCGGCLFQNLSYEHQLDVKSEYVRSLFAEIPDLPPLLENLKVKGSIPFGYRNRMDFVCAFGKRGLRERGTFDCVVDIERCMIMNDRMNEVWTAVRDAVQSIEDYDFLIHNGYLRYAVMRSAHFTNEIMVNFVVSRDTDEINSAIDKIFPLVDSISVLEHSGLADLSFGKVLRDHKRGYIEENFNGINYRITPNSFFQSNSPCSLEMYSRIAEESRGKVLDLFSGVGSISLFVAGKVESLIGVEIVEEAVVSARINAERNNVANAQFVCADALPFMKENANRFNTLILDPPRTGAHPKVMKAIEVCAPERIVYMSCNPSTFKDNLTMLPNYRVTSFEAYDMFPQTPHLETLAVLERR